MTNLPTKIDQKSYLSISEAAKFLEVSPETLRRWDKNGKLKALRKSERGHRFYSKEDIGLFSIDLFEEAIVWSSNVEGKIPKEGFYCQNTSVFSDRLSVLVKDLKNILDLTDFYSVIGAMVGEIGDNSFAHNLGNWPDVPGIFFAYDLNKREIVLADRGLGVFYTLKRVRPNLRDHQEALKLAFTEVVSGRAPEVRGNGLKFVRREVVASPIKLYFQTGDAKLELEQGQKELKIKKTKLFIRGCAAVIKF